MKNPKIEALKEVGRWVILFVVSWIITSTINQVGNVPETAQINVWVFTYMVPVRQLFVVSLTMAGRYADKYLHETSKQEIEVKFKGLLPF